MPSAKAASSLVSALADVGTASSARAVDYVLINAINVIAASTLDSSPGALFSVDCARAAMVITELASVDKAPKFVLTYQRRLRSALWQFVRDENITVREQGIRGLQAILKTVVVRASSLDSKIAMDYVVRQLRDGLSQSGKSGIPATNLFPSDVDSTGSVSEQSATSPSRPSRNRLHTQSHPSSLSSPAVIHGCLCMLGSLISSPETIPYMHPLTSEIFYFALLYQAHADDIVRKAVAHILPLVIGLDRPTFTNNFLEKVYVSTMKLVNNKDIPADERGRSLVSIATILEQLQTCMRDYMLEEMLILCKKTLSSPPTDMLIPRDAILTTVSHLASASHGNLVFERKIREGLLMRMFSTNVTNLLVSSVAIVRAAVPSLDDFIHRSLVNLIAATLKKALPEQNTGMPFISKADRIPADDSTSSSDSQNYSFHGLQSTSSSPGSYNTDDMMSHSPRSFSDITMANRTAVSRATPQDFFKQCPFSSELHRLDSSSSLTSKSTSTTLEGLLQPGPISHPEKPLPHSNSSLQYTANPLIEENNSPCVALQAIVSYEFVGMKHQDFTSFAGEYVIGYLESNNVKTRALAVAASTKLMLLACDEWHGTRKKDGLSRKLQSEILMVLAQLVAVAVSDPSKDVRFVAMRSLDQLQFRAYLLQPEMLGTLFLSFHDESLGMRDSAISLVGRLGNFNPSYAIPSLRSYLIHLLTILRFDGSHFARLRREATELINTLVHNAGYFVEPYTGIVIDALLIRLEEACDSHDTDSALPVLLTIAEMGGTTSRLDLKPYKESLIPLIVSSVLEVEANDVPFRKAGLRALAAVAQNTGFVIKPYEEHRTLLPKLLELLRIETDMDVRIEVEKLLGSLGAVDPDNHKYAALPILSFSGQFPHLGRRTMGNKQGKPLLRAESHITRTGVYWGGSEPYRSGSLSGSKASGLLTDNRHRRQNFDSRGSPQPNDLHGRTSKKSLSGNSAAVNPKSNDLHPSISWFGSGGCRLLKRIAGYSPEWAREEVEFVSFVGQLVHPFTASPDYFPAVLLDELNKLVMKHCSLHHLPDTYSAIVNILVAIGPRCSYYLPEVVPRMMWVVHQCSTGENMKYPRGIFLRECVVNGLSRLVALSGPDFVPYAFDSVLLAWNYFRQGKQMPTVTAAFCDLLRNIRHALGDEFKPVIVTLLPQLLASLASDKSSDGEATSAVLRTLESFCPLLENFSNTVLSTLSNVLAFERPSFVRANVMLSLIRMVRNMDSVDVLSCVVHPLIQILAGVFGIRDSSPGTDEQDVPLPLSSMNILGKKDFAEEDMPVLAAAALLEIGMRSTRSFDVFLKVVTKALRHSTVKKTNPEMYSDLRNFLAGRNPALVRAVLGDEVDNGSLRSDPVDPISGHRNGVQSGLSHTLISALRREVMEPVMIPASNPESSIMKIAETNLIEKWEVESHFKAGDWGKWLSDLGRAMFEHSGMASFRACVRISEIFPLFTKNLFNPAFLACWSAPLSAPAKAKIIHSLEVALTSQTAPLNVLQTLLSLFEFMDHDEKPLHISPETLALTANRCGALAKATRYREENYNHNILKPKRLLHEINGSNGLIAIYDKLGHVESAVGMIYHYQNATGSRVQEQWYEKLQRWDDALAVYEKIQATTHAENNLGNNVDLFCDKRKWDSALGRLRCFNSMGEWRKMIALLSEVRSTCDGSQEAMRQLALEGKALSVTFDLGLWKEFEEWLRFIHTDTYDGCFYKTLLLLKQGKDNPYRLDEARDMIGHARHHLDLELTALVSEGYPRAYSHVVRAQTLVELEEMTDYLDMPSRASESFGKARLQEVWSKRLMGCKRDRFTWYRVLMTRALVLKPIESKDQWLEYATMCRKAKLLPMATEALRMLVTSYSNTIGDTNLNSVSDNTSELGFDLTNERLLVSISDLELRFACIKHLWAMDRHSEAYCVLETCRNDFLAETGIALMDLDAVSYTAERLNDEKLVLAGEVFSKLSKWGHRLRDSGQMQAGNINDPLDYAYMATQIRPKWYKAWHYWAMMNGSRFEKLMQQQDDDDGVSEITRCRGSNGTQRIGTIEKSLLTHTVRGFFRAINLCGKSRLEDSLKLLTLWFRYGRYANMHHEFNKGFQASNVDHWLEVVPQVIARLHTPYAVVQKGVKLLLTRIGKAHPHVAVYPLTIAKTIGGVQGKRSRAAREILEELKNHHKEIVEQAEMVARELVRVAVLWPELWYEKLEEASKMYFNEHDVDAMVETLFPLHMEVEKKAETESERNFVAEFGPVLFEAGKLFRTYKSRRSSGASEDELSGYIARVWKAYSQIFQNILRRQQSMQELNLSYVSNGLDEATGLVLAVPGTYEPDENASVVRIEGFKSKLQVIQSKQRPRKLSIMGSNGREYQFLLKGHEDLRQDERVMQVFGLMNKLFSKSEQRSLLHGVGMTTYSVIALSANAGLIEWVPNHDTMHALVKKYREERSVMPNVEQWVMVQLAPTPERLSLLQKVDLFEVMLENTSGADLSRVMWLKSRNSEMWLDRRMTYAKSLATTSMTGYLLGLGDRHPSNVMIERSSGKVMHIDFGDCFEVAMKREKYPERVPFRLTRMLVDVLEPCGVEGVFRHTSIATMEVMRQHAVKEALMSMMEAFVYDPLIRWKLIGPKELTELKREEDAAAGRGRGRNTGNKQERKQRASANGQVVENRQVSASNQNEGTPSTMNGLGRDIPHDIDELIQSLTHTGSLQATMELQQQEIVENGMRLDESDAVGAIASPQASIMIPVGDGASKTPHSDEDEMIATPSYETRMQQARIMRDERGSHEMIAHVSNERAQLALDRFGCKLNGTDFDPEETLSVEEQVDLLVRDARNVENLCTLFLGWCAFW